MSIPVKEVIPGYASPNREIPAVVSLESAKQKSRNKA